MRDHPLVLRIARFARRGIVLSWVACRLDTIIAKEIATSSKDGLRRLCGRFSRDSFWGVSDVPQSDAVRASRRCVWRGLGAVLRPKILSDFRPNNCPLFGQKQIQFSAKALSAFRPKNCPLFEFCFSVFGKLFGRFPFFDQAFAEFGFQLSPTFGEKSGHEIVAETWPKNGVEKRTRVAHIASGLAFWAPRPRISCGRFSA